MLTYRNRGRENADISKISKSKISGTLKIQYSVYSTN